MDLGECKDKGIIRKVRIDKNLVMSLVDISKIKEQTIKKVIMDGVSINAYLPMAYDSLREILEGFCILYGYKVGNHDCLGKLVNELIKDFDLFLFDRFRYVRNGINYYGSKIGLEEGKLLIEKIFKMKMEILELLNKKLKE